MAQGQFGTDDLLELFSPCGHVRVKRMFGGQGIYLDGLFFALTFGDDIYLKVDEANLPLFVAEDLPPFVYDPGNGRKPISLSYRRMPDVCFDEPDALRIWVAGAVDAARRAAVLVERKKSKTRQR